MLSAAVVSDLHPWLGKDIYLSHDMISNNVAF